MIWQQEMDHWGTKYRTIWGLFERILKVNSAANQIRCFSKVNFKVDFASWSTETNILF